MGLQVGGQLALVGQAAVAAGSQAVVAAGGQVAFALRVASQFGEAAADGTDQT